MGNELVKLGDVIECQVSNPVKTTIRVTLTTHKSVAYANNVILKTDGWTVEPQLNNT